MKQIIYVMLAVVSLSWTSCSYDDTDVWNAINGQEERIAALESWQKTANENIAALQAIVNENDYITGVTAIVESGDTIGYKITFRKQGEVTIHNGTDGTAGATPVIGLTQQSDGKYYWTLNGELMKDADGNTICANGKDGADGEDGTDGSNGTSAPTPKVKTENGKVYLSVDGEKSWHEISGTSESGFFSSFSFNDVSATFTLSNGTSITVPKYVELLNLYYQVDGSNTRTLITNGQLTVPRNTDFSIICITPDKGSAWDYSIMKSTAPYTVTKVKEGLHFTKLFSGTIITIQFTLTTTDNQVVYYQVTVTVGATTEPETVIIPNDNTELVEALKGLGFPTDDEGNVEINQEMISSTSSLNLAGKSLTSLEGLDCFTELTSLSINENTLTSIDISAFPKLTYLSCANNQLTSLEIPSSNNLTRLDCSNNPLSTLDLSNLSGLETLNCSGCFNQESIARSYSNRELDLSTLLNLKELNCSNNGLTALDVTHNTQLLYLYCYDNQLTTLDVTNNTKLYSLSCYDNQIKELDVKKNTDLTTLRVHDNQLSSIDLSANSELSVLIIAGNPLSNLDLSSNVKLEFLNCRGNFMEGPVTLDFSKNTELYYLDCAENSMTTLDVTKNKKLQSLYCYSNQLVVLDISQNLYLEDLSCDKQKHSNGTYQLLTLTINENQKERWENNWSSFHEHVTITNKSMSASGGTGSNYNNGGIY